MTDLVHDAASEDLEAWQVQLGRLPRDEPELLEHYFHSLGEAVAIDGTRTRLHTHWLAFDANGRPRLDHLARMLADTIVDYCIPRERILAAQTHMLQTGSTRKLSALKREAKGLFNKLANSGEGGELLLYFLMETGLRIPQVLSKMALKTDSQMHFHGVDGVHVKALESGNLAVYWGESKVYASFASAVNACFTGLAPYLNDTGFGALREDVLLVRDNLDAGNRELSLKLAEFFTEDTAEANHLEARGACLIGYTHENFASPFEDDGVTVLTDTLDAMSAWQEGVRDKLSATSVDTFEIEVFCVPLPSSDDFRKSLARALELSA